MTITSAQLDEYCAKGFARVPGFLSAPEIGLLRQDHAQASRVSFRFYGVKDVTPACIGRMRERLLDLSRAVAAGSSTKTDMLSGAIYWASRRGRSGVTDGWHQDHDSWWLWGREHVNYLHLYLPIVKPDPRKTGLTLAPLDRLRECSLEAHQLVVGQGGRACKRKAGSTTIFNRDTGARRKLPFDIETIAESPELAEGDLLIFRGDVLHRTQDRETDRVAVSFRMANMKTVVRQANFLEWGSPQKFVLLMTNHVKYRAVLEALRHHGDGCQLGQVQQYLDTAYGREPTVSFVNLLSATIRTAVHGLIRG